MRLHPLHDGVLDLTLSRRDAERREPLDRDHPTQMATSSVTVDSRGVSGAPSASVRDYLRVAADQYVDASALIRNDGQAPIGLVVRLTTDGDDPLVTTRVRVYQWKGTDEENVRSDYSARKEMDKAVRAVMTSCGWTGAITKEIRSRVIQMIELEKSRNALVAS